MTNAGSVQLSNNGLLFTTSPRPFNVVDVVVDDAGKSIQSFITILPLQGDTCDVIWKADLSSNSFFSKFQNFGRAQKLKTSMASVLKRLQQGEQVAFDTLKVSSAGLEKTASRVSWWRT